MGFASIGISHLSLQYVGIPVTATTTSGAAYDPTGDTVQMAFMPQATQFPQSGDWKTAIWGTDTSNLLYPYAAYCLVGPGGTVTLDLGSYYLYLRITDSPEIPVLLAGILQIQ